MKCSKKYVYIEIFSKKTQRQIRIHSIIQQSTTKNYLCYAHNYTKQQQHKKVFMKY